MLKNQSRSSLCLRGIWAAVLLVIAATCSAQSIASVVFTPSSFAGPGTVSLVVTMSSAAPPNQSLHVSLSTNLPNAVDLPSEVDIAPGKSSATVTPNVYAASRTSSLTVTATFGNSSCSGTLTLLPMAVSALSISPASVSGGSTTVGTVTVSQAVPAPGLVVSLSCINPSVTVPKSVTIPANATYATFTIRTSPVLQNISAAVTASTSNSKNASLSIAVPNVSQLYFTPASVVGGHSTTGYLVLSSPSPGLSVALTSSSNATMIPSEITIPAGKTSTEFTVNTLPQTSGVMADLTATCSVGTITANLYVAAPGFTFTVASSNQFCSDSFSATVKLDQPAPRGGAIIALTSSLAAIRTPASIMVPAGQTTVAFQIPTTFVANQQSATITASYRDSNSVFVNLLPLTLANTAWPENRANSFGTGQGVSTVSGSNPVWQFQAGGSIESSFAIGPDGSIYFGCDDGCLYALAADGQLEWKFKTGISNSASASPAVAADGTIYTLGGNGTLFAIRADGTLKWSYVTGQSYGCPVSLAANGTIYFAAGSQYGYWIDWSIFAVYPDGNLYWSKHVGAGVLKEILVRPDESLCFSMGHFFVMSPQGAITHEFRPGSRGDMSDAVIDQAGNEYFYFQGAINGLDPSGHLFLYSKLSTDDYGTLGIAMDAENNIIGVEVQTGDPMAVIVTSVSTSGATNWSSTVVDNLGEVPVSYLTIDAASSVFFECAQYRSSYYLCKLDSHGNLQWKIPISSASTPIVTGDNALIAATGVGVVSKLK